MAVAPYRVAAITIRHHPHHRRLLSRPSLSEKLEPRLVSRRGALEPLEWLELCRAEKPMVDHGYPTMWGPQDSVQLAYNSNN